MDTETRDELPMGELSMRWTLTELETMRLEELAASWPMETKEMLREGTLREYLASWRRSAEALLESLMDPSRPGNAYEALGLREEMKVTQPQTYYRRVQMVPATAREMMVRTMVLAPLVPTES